MGGWVDGRMVMPGKGLLTAIKNYLNQFMEVESTYGGQINLWRLNPLFGGQTHLYQLINGGQTHILEVEPTYRTHLLEVQPTYTWRSNPLMWARPPYISGFDLNKVKFDRLTSFDRGRFTPRAAD